MRGRALLLGTLLVAAAAASAAPARADDPPPKRPPLETADALARLSPDELAAVRRRFPAWDDLAEPVRQRIAANVLRLRSLSPEQRDLLLQRARRAEAAGVGVLADLPRRMSAYKGFGPEQKASWREKGRLQRLAVVAVLRSLPPEARAALDPRQSDALSEGERRELEAAVSAHWRRVMQESYAKRADTLGEAALAPSTPPEVVARIDRLRQELRRPGPRRPGIVMELSMLLAQERMRVALSRVPPPEPGARPEARRAHEAAAAGEIAKEFSESLGVVSAELAAAASKGRAGLSDYVRAHRDDAGPPRERRLVELLLSLERLRSDLPADAGGHAEALETAVLRMLIPTGKVTESDASAFAAKSAPERQRFLVDLKRALTER